MRQAGPETYINEVLSDGRRVVWFRPEGILKLHRANDLVNVEHQGALSYHLVDDVTEGTRRHSFCYPQAENVLCDIFCS